MRRKWMQAFIGVVAGLTVAGCGSSRSSGSSGPLITDAELCQFRYNVTTPDQVTAAFGQPTRLISDAVGEELDYDYLTAVSPDWLETDFTFSNASGSELLISVSRLQNGTLYGPVPSCLSGQ